MISLNNHPSNLTLDFEAIFNQSPLPTSIYDREGTVVAFNDAHGAMWNIPREGWIGRFNMVTDPQLAAQGTGELFVRVMRGETVVRPPHPFDSSATGLVDVASRKRWVEATYYPLHASDGTVTHLVATLRDVTQEVEQAAAIAAAQAEIASQRAIIETLSSPVVQVWQGVLTMPLVGTIDSRRATTITENLLRAITERRADCVILDITGVPIVDTQIAQHLISTAHACRLLGCDVALVGIGVEMAQTLVQLGVDLSALVTLADLQAGVAWGFTRRKLRVVQAGREQLGTVPA
jgi:rsbT co-antagonist protein RsbR